MKYLLGIIFAVLLTVNIGSAQHYKHHSQYPLNCQECHLCKNPTAAKPCLKICPKFVRKGVSAKHTLKEAPKIIVIDTLANQYTPVVFDHYLHASMAQMNGGCTSCHHHNPPGKILPCSTCHQKGVKRTDLSKPSLKGAYHQLCISCHREWNSEWQTKSNCTTCHKNAQVHFDVKKAQEEAKHLFPTPKRPKQFVLKTDWPDEPIVTFHHKEHIETFGLKCEACHKNTSCSDCHKTEGHEEITKKKLAALSHENCMPCHKTAIEKNCTFCHSKKERKAFDHAQTGWPLKPFHKSLTCTECHKDGFKRLSTNCNSCHNTNKWQPGTFDHSVTGIELDENHRDTDCDECHINRDFSKKPQCTDCHDDKSFPKNVPGKILKR